MRVTEPDTQRLRWAKPAAALISGGILLAAAVAAAAYGVSGLGPSQSLVGTTVSLHSTWEKTRVVTHTGELDAGRQYAICAGPTLVRDDVTVVAGSDADAGAPLAVSAIPKGPGLTDSYAFGVITCEPRVVFTPTQGGVHTIVFKKDPMTEPANGIELAHADAFYEVQPGIDRMWRGFPLAVLCLLLGIGLTIAGSYGVHWRRGVQRAFEATDRTP